MPAKVLDSFALIAYFRDEPGAAIVENLLLLYSLCKECYYSFIIIIIIETFVNPIIYILNRYGYIMCGNMDSPNRRYL